MAKYNLETETTVHLKGMSFSESSETGGYSMNALALGQVAIMGTPGAEYSYDELVIITSDVPPTVFDSPMAFIFPLSGEMAYEAAKRCIITGSVPSEYEGVPTDTLPLIVLMPIGVLS